jgi:hypothetical protein
LTIRHPFIPFSAVLSVNLTSRRSHMRSAKLKLDVDELKVESLAIPAAPSRRGTVRGNMYYYESEWNDTVYRETDPSGWNDTVLYETQQVSCGGTCGTCGGTDCWA